MFNNPQARIEYDMDSERRVGLTNFKYNKREWYLFLLKTLTGYW